VSASKIVWSSITGVLLIGIVSGPTLLSFYGKHSTALLLLVCLLIVLLALNVNVDQLEHIGLGPLTAKLRAKIALAEDLNDRLKKAIELTLSVAVSAAMRSGRFADKNRNFHKKLVDDVDAIVDTSGLSPDQRRNILKEYVYFTEFDMRLAMVGSAVHSGSETGTLANKVRAITTSSEEALQIIRRLAEMYECGSEEWFEWLKDYEHLVKSSELRRPEIWFRYEGEPSSEGLIRKYANAAG
jgi:hypothetical protein